MTPLLVKNTIGSILLFSLIWTVLVTVCLYIDMIFWNRPLDDRGWLLISFAASAAFTTAIIAWFLESTITAKRPIAARFASIFFLLAIGSLGATYLLTTFYNLPRAIDGMGSFTSYYGLKDLLYFFLAHGYFFAGSATRLFLPLGPVALCAMSLIYCSRLAKQSDMY